MVRKTEEARILKISVQQVAISSDFEPDFKEFKGACCVVLPAFKEGNSIVSYDVIDYLGRISDSLPTNGTLLVTGENFDLMHLSQFLGNLLTYQTWITVKRSDVKTSEDCISLPVQTFGILVYTKYKGTLKHAKTRVEYDYCKNCERTVKDYGGKKHLYDEFGTLISDVWKDITVSLEGQMEELYNALAMLFGISEYEDLIVFDTRYCVTEHKYLPTKTPINDHINKAESNKLVLGDSLTKLKEIPDNSVDFIFADPPYNLKKKYDGANDDLKTNDYFEWCNKWIYELYRVLKPARTICILNIPISNARYSEFMSGFMKFQNWIVWDALSNPERKIMPAHYSIICFTKGESRSLPGLERLDDCGPESLEKKSLLMDSADYCLRSSCVKERKLKHINDKTPITDLWSDLHRLKHNTRRVDHPTQVPPKLMYRLISAFTKENELVLDPFNGSGTTTLCAAQLKRAYIGIEKSVDYYNLSQRRHEELNNGLDPFRKESRKLNAKNSLVPRVKKQKYEVPKKTLQLEVKEIAQKIGHSPSRNEVIKFSKYPIKYFDDYFLNWAEVCAAVRSTGMTEKRNIQKTLH